MNSHIDAAIRLQEKQNTAYIAIGKTSAWADDNNPPNEDMYADSLTEVVGYKKVKQFSLARPLGEGEDPDNLQYPVITYAQQQWVLIPKTKAYEEEARWLYIEAEITPDDLPLGNYRQVGLHTGLTPKAGVTKQNLLPSEVADVGVLKFIENKEPQNRTSSIYVTEQFIVKV